MRKKTICLLLAILLLVQIAPVPAAAADENAAGSFVFAAAKAGQVIIAPTRFAYAEGQTVHDVLKSGPDGHSFSEQSSGFINVIDGVEGNFSRYDNNGNYALDVPANQIEAFFFVSADLLLDAEKAQAFSTMLTAMADFNASDNGVQKYAPAAEAYSAANDALLGAEADYAALAEKLRTAMQEYVDTVLNAKTYPLALEMQNLSGQNLDTFVFTVDDSYGNSFRFTEDDSLALSPGDYSFTLSCGENSARGVMTVTAPEEDGEAATVSINGETVDSICLHDGASWMGDIFLLSKSLNGTIEGDAYPQQGNTYYIPDSMSAANIYVSRGAGLDQNRFTTATVSLFPIYTTVKGVEFRGDKATEKRAWESTSTAIYQLVEAGSGDTSLRMEARCAFGGYTLVESRQIDIVRTPTLKGLSIYADGAVQNIGFQPLTQNYELTVCAGSVRIAPQLDQKAGYSVTVNGEPLLDGEKELALTQVDTEVTVTVANAGGQSRTYRVLIHKVDSISVSVAKTAGIQVAVLNSAGAEIGAYESTETDSKFHLVAGEKYTCVSTLGTYYHASIDFTAAAGMTISAPTPMTENWINGLGLRSIPNSASATVYLETSKFDPEQHSYQAQVPDRMKSLYIAANVAENTELYAVEAEKTVAAYPVEDLNKKAYNVSGFLDYGDRKQSLTLRVSKEVGAVTQYQDYTVEFVRTLSLKDKTGLGASASGETIELYREENGTLTTNKTFGAAYFSYGANVSSALQQITLSVTPYSKEYEVYVNGSLYPYDEVGEEKSDTVQVLLNLDHTVTEEAFEVRLVSAAEGAVSQTYSVTLHKKNPILTIITVTDADTEEQIPEDGKYRPLAVVYDSMSGERVWPDASGRFALIDTMEYRIDATCYGYVSKELTITAGDDNRAITVALTKAPEQTERPQLDSSWPSFRGSDDANGVVSFATPTEAENTALSWASRLGEGYSADAVSCPILITENGYEYLIVYSGTTLYKVDAISGVTVATGTMDHKSSFAINSATYAEGMIFVGLANGTVQAFDAATLESLWIYRDKRGGQPNCPITYADGYIYTGFWNSETTPANFACISVTDEDPTRTDEEKLAAWTHTDNGFYWAGSYVDKDGQFLLVGTDDGDPGYLKATARLLCMDPATGELLDTIDGICGDLRSNVSYDSQTQRYFFTSKGGYLYSTKITISEGKPSFDDAAFRAVRLYNYSSDAENPPMSTCTPVVYNGRAYVGVSGVAQFGAYSGHNISVIDLNTWTIAYSVPTQGYPQTSGLLTTAYESKTGYVYVYFFDNFTPGKLRALKDKAGQKTPVLTTPEEGTYQGVTKTYQTPYVLFTPAGDQAQYAICSPIADSYGTIYFKNDSAYLMALTNRITKVEITKAPDKTEYRPGEHFDPTGMMLRLTYANGQTRDIPAVRTVNGKEICYVSWTEGKNGLSAGDTETTVRFAYVMYQNGENGEAGREITSPAAVQKLTVTSPQGVLGDVNQDGEIDMTDLTMVIWHVNEVEGKTLTGDQYTAADVNRDGEVDMTDLTLMIWYLNEVISQFPAEG